MSVRSSNNKRLIEITHCWYMCWKCGSGHHSECIDPHCHNRCIDISCTNRIHKETEKGYEIDFD